MEKSDTEERLAERVVREAVGMGMESPLRETIVEAVDEAEGGRSSGTKIPMAGALVGLGAAFGYLLGTRSEQLSGQSVSVDDLAAPEMIEEVTEEVAEPAEEVAGSSESESTDEGSGARRLPRIVLAAGMMAVGIALARRLRSGEEEEWEPIEEFESTVEDEFGEEGEDEESEGMEGEEMDEDESEESEMEAGESEMDEE